jgi:6-phosphofructokinase 1
MREVCKQDGYELRCADPIPYDTEYTRYLRYGAVKSLGSQSSEQDGAMVTFLGGRMQPLPFEQSVDRSTDVAHEVG